MKALIHARIFDYLSYIDDGYILFDHEICEVGCMEHFHGAEEVVDCKRALVLPGLINCHTHIYSAFARGMNVPFHPHCFKDILDQLWWKLDRQLDRDSIYSSALTYGVECVQSGVTAIIDHHASGICIQGALQELNQAIGKELGIRGIYCFETSDRFPLMECIEENLAFERHHSQRTGSMFGLHASMSLSDESLKEISKVLKGRPIHIHVAESLDDVKDCYTKYNQSIIERLDSYGLLNSKSILSHCVHINDQEAALIAKRNCYVALNPTSNMNNAVGLPDYELLRKHDIKCLVGNDGLGANITRDYLNLFFAMKHRQGSPTKFSMDDLVQIIRNGYDYISSCLGIQLGRVQKGYQADLVVVPYLAPTPINASNMLGHLIFGVFDCFKPQQVWIDGKCVLNDYELTMNTTDIYEKARIQAAKVWERLEINEKGE